MAPLSLREITLSLVGLVGITLFPGAFVATVLSLKQELPTTRFILWSVGWSVGINGITAYIMGLLQGSLSDYVTVVSVLNVTGMVVVVIHLLRTKFQFAQVQTKQLAYSVLILSLAFAWFAIMLHNGARIDYHWDQWFHLAHIREGVESNRIIPENPFWDDESLSDMFGLWHPLLATIAHSAEIDVTVLWRVGNAYMGALGFVVVYAIAGVYLPNRTTRVVAAVVFLGSGFGPVEITRTFIYPWGITNILFWISLAIFMDYLDTGDVWDLLLAILAGWVPVLIHPQEYIILCFGVFALATSAMLLKKTSQKAPVNIGRVWMFGLLLVVSGLPVLILKYPNRLPGASTVPLGGFVSIPDLPLYEAPVAKMLALTFPYYWKLGMLAISFLPYTLLTLMSLFLLPMHLDPRRRWFFITLAWAPTLATLVPGLSTATAIVLKETYAWRLLTLVPIPFIWASIMVEGVSIKILRKPSKDGVEAKFLGPLGWGYFLHIVFMALSVIVSIYIAGNRKELGPTEVTPLHAHAMFEQLDRASTKPAVVLSDPTTSYAIPGMTKHFVVLNEPSHGSRADIVERYAKARQLLSGPYQTPQDAVSVLTQYNIGLILINKSRLGETFFLQTPFYSEYTLQFLDTNPQCFEHIYKDDTFEMYRYLRCEPSEMKSKGQQIEHTVHIEEIEHMVQVDPSSTLTLIGYSLSPSSEVSAGEKLTVDLYWQAKQNLQEPYAIFLEVLCDYPGHNLPFGKALRHTMEALSNKRYHTHLGSWLPIPPEGLSTQALTRQTMILNLPANMTRSICSLNLQILTRRQVLFDQEVLPYLLMEREYTLPHVTLGLVDITE